MAFLRQVPLEIPAVLDHKPRNAGCSRPTLTEDEDFR